MIKHHHTTSNAKAGIRGRFMKRLTRLPLLVLALLISTGSYLQAQSQCARVKIEIRQELTLERQAFDAHMRINNGLDGVSLKDVSVEVTFSDENGLPVAVTSNPNDNNASFFMTVDSMENISNVSGTGTVAPNTSADIHWLIIPAFGASGDTPLGKSYNVGATLTYSLDGEEYVTEVTPDFITVRPMPQLVLDYFLPIDVRADDPFTIEVEPPVPFDLGVRVTNNGFGPANKLKIESSQPTITENENNLIIGFQIIDSSVNGVPSDKALIADFGNLAGKSAVTARWKMITTVSGRFEKFGATYTHADELGGQLTSLIDDVFTHRIISNVLVDLSGRDGLEDFLALEENGDIKVFETDGTDTDTTDVSSDLSLSGSGDTFTISGMAPRAGFVYGKLKDPRGGTVKLARVVREDGKALAPQNAWLTSSYDKEEQTWKHYLSIFDIDPPGLTYTAYYQEATAQGNQPPVLAYTGDKTVAQGTELNLITVASDPNGTIPTMGSGSLPIGASFTDRGDGTGLFSWTPTAAQTGSYPIRFTASDGELADRETIMVTVTSQPGSNQAPVAQDSLVQLLEDTTATGFMEASDADGDALTFSVVSQPNQGVLTLLDPAVGHFSYAPNPDTSGLDSFSFTASDGNATSQTATVSLQVAAVNDAPTLASADLSTDRNTASSPASPTVTDPDEGDAHEIAVVDPPANGQASVVDNQLIYTPDTDYFGTDSFSFRATDSGGLSVVGNASVTIVLGANGQILGVCFHDLDGDGVFDAGEPGLPALSVYLDLDGNGQVDAGEPEATTDANGNFALTGLSDGTYTLRDALPADHRRSLPTSSYFGSATTLTAPTGAAALTHADLNSDGHADLIVADTAGSQLSLFLGNASGFAAPTHLALTQAPNAAAVADVNGDGHLDLLALQNAAGTVSVLNGQGDGGFAAATTAVTVGATDAFVVADLNGDTHADIALTDTTDNTIKTYINQTDGTFATGTTIDPLGAPVALAAVNLDSQSAPELVIARTDALLIYANDGAAVFSAAASISSADIAQLHVADLNGDTNQDLLTAHSGSQLVSWFAGDGANGFAAAHTIDTGITVASLTSADHNGDGYLDLILTDGSTAALTWLEGTGFGQFQGAQSVSTTVALEALLPADFDGDGDVDLAQVAPNHLGVSFNDQTPVISLTNSETVNLDRGARNIGGVLEGIVFEDIDGNGLQDVGENGLAGQTLYLDADDNGQLDTGETSQTTNAQGIYHFTDVPVGDHTLRLAAAAGWHQTAPADGHIVTVAANQTTNALDFGSQQIAVGDLLVTSLIDAADANPGDGIVDDGSGNATLRAAIMEANALPGADTIILPAGIYAMSLVGTLEDLAATGDLDITDDLTITGSGATTTSIDAGGTDRIFHVLSGVTLNLSGVTLTGGDTGTTGTTQELSGGALLTEGTTILDAVVFHNNLAEESGGAAYVTGALTVSASTMHTNSAYEGGAMASADGATLQLTNTTLSGNTATTSGGALTNLGTATLTHVTVSANTAASSGGLHQGGTGTTTLTNNLIAGNNAGVDPDTGGAFTSNGGNLVGIVGAATGLVHGAGGDIVGDDVSPIDALLDPLATLHGTTPVHPLQTGSPAIDAAVASAVTTDQHGIARTVDGDGNGNGDPDMGASEMQPYVLVTAPNGGESLLPGDTIDLTWTTSGFTGDVKLEYTLDGGSTWIVLRTSAGNDGHFSFPVPATPTTQGLFRISSVDQPTVSDTSDSVFTILTPVLTLDTHDSGVVMTPGAETEILYTATNFKGGLRIEVSTDGGTTWEVIAGSTGLGGRYVWNVPSTGSTDVKFRLTSTYREEITTTSSGTNTILTPSIQLQSHNGGAQMVPGSTAAITYQAQNFEGGVRVEVSYDSGATWTILNNSFGQGGTFSWFVPAQASTGVRFRFSSTRLPEVSDTSDADNTILTPSISLNSHNGGEVMEPGSQTTLNYTVTNLAGGIHIEVSYDAGTTWETLEASWGQGPIYQWDVPTTGSTQVLFRLTSVYLPEISDTSDAVNTVLIPVLNVTSPNGGETLTVGNTVNLTWDLANLYGGVALTLSRDGGTTWETINDNLGTVTSYSWTVTGPASSNVLFKVASRYRAHFGDTSDAVFSITD